MKGFLGRTTKEVATRVVGYAYSHTGEYGQLTQFIENFLIKVDQSIVAQCQVLNLNGMNLISDEVIEQVGQVTLQTLCVLHNICVLFLRNPAHIVTNFLLWEKDSTNDELAIALKKWLSKIDPFNVIPFIRSKADCELAQLILQTFRDLKQSLDGFVPKVVPRKDELIQTLSEILEGVIIELSKRIKKSEQNDRMGVAREGIHKRLASLFRNNLGKCKTGEEVEQEYGYVVEALRLQLVRNVYQGNTNVFRELAAQWGISSQEKYSTPEQEIEAAGPPDANILSSLRMLKGQRLEELQQGATNTPCLEK